MTLVDIVGSRGKAQILRFLFALDPREFHLRELTRQSRLALGTVQQELRRLVRTGLVTARKDGNRLYYQANRQNPVYSDLRNIVLKTDGLVQILQTALPSAMKFEPLLFSAALLPTLPARTATST